jgi:hypothetical protein
MAVKVIKQALFEGNLAHFIWGDICIRLPVWQAGPAPYDIKNIIQPEGVRG